MGTIDWTKLAESAPSIIGALLYAVFALAVIGFFMHWLERHDAQWQKVIESERHASSASWAGVTKELQEVAAITKAAYDSISAHDIWEKGQTENVLSAVGRNAGALHDLAEEQRRVTRALIGNGNNKLANQWETED